MQKQLFKQSFKGNNSFMITLLKYQNPWIYLIYLYSSFFFECSIWLTWRPLLISSSLYQTHEVSSAERKWSAFVQNTPVLKGKYKKIPYETQYCLIIWVPQKQQPMFFCIDSSVGILATSWLHLFYLNFWGTLIAFICTSDK